ncbi:PAS domain S-box-containing protein/diguanylate cyclase (GGDEF)-like protein [Modicisalibacter xianhensis]|uniref:PAS domain S-box-containing protein/diguanylate cyclase (GGDEF)-like protein n=1 Tax=Modicisalibacter xianhensis TaxID=442341 RepID=A0A4R8G0M7_9GAMM|nr:EAL domain-containing protein [Halomonas xianhensis]TDX33009.1 PAS domain S-box-containing protein/diguanylate cyclase (GGDEF)-like protein [Halomonas xianhensis]
MTDLTTRLSKNTPHTLLPLNESQQSWLLRSIFEYCQEGILITDANKNIVDANPAFTRITGFTREEVLGKKPHILSSGKHTALFYQNMFVDVAEQGFWSGNIKNRHRDGSHFIAQTTITAIHTDSGKLSHFFSIFRDVTQHRLSQARLERLAVYDPLTHLFNREHFTNALHNLIDGLRYTETGLAVLFMDLDDFKPVNDRFGHTAGDELLIEISHRLKRMMRSTDMVARFGGDEFMVALPGMANLDMAESIAGRILKEIVRPYVLSNGQSVQVSGSIGIAFTVYPGSTAEALIDMADAVMYDAKQNGKNCIATSHDTPESRSSDTFIRIRQAFEQGELTLHYQPIIRLKDLHTIGFEALARWHHPSLGILGPQHFVEVITCSSLCHPFAQWLIRRAGEMARRLQDLHIQAVIGINLTQEQIESGCFLRTLGETRDELGLASPFVTIEIHESSQFHDLDLTSNQLHEARQLGATVALDDFGTGISSVTYAAELPIDTLKIDRTMIKSLEHRPDQREFVRGVTLMTQAMRRKVVAEGVESEAQLNLLRELGCDSAQGFYLGYPMTAEDLETHYLAPGATPRYPLIRQRPST